jgi:hypothetical protein
MGIHLLTETYHENTDRIELYYKFDNVEDGLWFYDICTAHDLPVFPKRSTIESMFTQYVRVLIANEHERLILKLAL